jgi:hypothetical protein
MAVAPGPLLHPSSRKLRAKPKLSGTSSNESEDGLVRVVDESREDDLYPKAFFRPIAPRAVKREFS